MNSIMLLHQSSETLLLKPHIASRVLNNYKFLIKKTILALESFIKEKYCLFDSHVGDSACQIRAYKMLSIINKSKNTIEKDLNLLKSKYEELLIFYLKNKNMQSFEKSTIYEFLNKNSLIFYISEETIFLSTSYLLSEIKTKDLHNDIMIDHNTLSSMMNISRKSSKKLVHYYQKRLAKLSTEFIFEILNDLPNAKQTSELLNRLARLDGDGRSILPCYITMKTLLSHMLKTNKNILVNLKIKNSFNLIIDSINLFYNFHQNTFETEKDKENKISFDEPLVMIDAVIENDSYFTSVKNIFIQQLKKEGLTNLILYYMAAHPQYSSPDLSHEEIFNNEKSQFFKKIKDEINEMKLNAEKKGCHTENKRLFFIEHIYCDKPRNKIKHGYNIVNESNCRKLALA